MYSVNVTFLSADTIGRSPYLGIAFEASLTVSNSIFAVVMILILGSYSLIHICTHFSTMLSLSLWIVPWHEFFYAIKIKNAILSFK